MKGKIVNTEVFQRNCIIAALIASCTDYGQDPHGPLPTRIKGSMRQFYTELFNRGLGNDQRSLIFRLLFAQVYQEVWLYFSQADHPLSILRVVVQRGERAHARETVANFVEQSLLDGSLLEWIGSADVPEMLALHKVRQIASAFALYSILIDQPNRFIEHHEEVEHYAQSLHWRVKKKALPHLFQLFSHEQSLPLFRGQFCQLYHSLVKFLQVNAYKREAFFHRRTESEQMEEIQEGIKWILPRLKNDFVREALQGITPDILQEVCTLFHALRVEDLKQENKLIEQNESSPTHCSAKDCDEPQHDIVAELTMYFPGKQGHVTVFACKRHRRQIEEYVASSPYLRTLEEQAEAEMGTSIIAETTIVRYADPTSIPTPRSPEKESLLLERFRLRQRPQASSLVVRHIFAEFGIKCLPFLNAFHDGYIDLARKYRLDARAFDIASYLPEMPLIQAVISALRDQYLWIELEQPIETPRGILAAFSFGVKGEHIFQYAVDQSAIGKSMQERLRAILHPDAFPYQIGIDAVDPTGSVIWTLSFAFVRNDRGEMKIMSIMPTWAKRCDESECPVNGSLCPECEQICAYYFSLYANCLRLIRGDLRQSEEPQILPVVEKKAIRKDPDPVRAHKFKEHEITHKIQLVIFNALGKETRLSPNGPKSSRGSPQQLWRPLA